MSYQLILILIHQILPHESIIFISLSAFYHELFMILIITFIHFLCIDQLKTYFCIIVIIVKKKKKKCYSTLVIV